jgi:ABC-type Fe3+/spermidine/putrescine transport system ATPase subunit
MPQPMLRVQEIVKSFAPGQRVLKGVSTQAADGEIACLLGPSGCGKTTLLRIIAGLETPDSGRVFFGGEDVTGQPVHLRRFGYMFQDYALFPHMNVAANVDFGLRMMGWDGRRQQERVDELLNLVNLEGYGRRAVDGLSGGEQQRVALARTLAPAPRLLMLDEPLANLDRLLREELVDELRTILKRIGITTIFVTHDQAEAFALADHVVVMRAGQIEQEGTPQTVHRAPANAFVAQFLGFHNLLAGKALPDEHAPSGWAVETVLGHLPLPTAPAASLLAEPYCVLIRPDAAVLEPSDATGAAHLDGVVTAASLRGGLYRLQISPRPAPEQRLTFELPTRSHELLPRAGEQVRLHLDARGVLLVRE